MMFECTHSIKTRCNSSTVVLYKVICFSGNTLPSDSYATLGEIKIIAATEQSTHTLVEEQENQTCKGKFC